LERFSFIKDKRKNKFIKKIAETKKTQPITPFYYLLDPHDANGKKVPEAQGIAYGSYQGRMAFFAGMVPYGPSDISRLSGNIYLPVTAEELDWFRLGTGHATMLDGGFVCIEEVIDAEGSLSW
jgi:hypothetical protein